MAFTHLPPELYEKILIHLKAHDIWSCAGVCSTPSTARRATLKLLHQTCKLLRSAVTSSPLIQYHLELQIAALDEGQTSAQSIQDRRQALRAYQKRWNTLDWSSRVRAQCVCTLQSSHASSLTAGNLSFWDNGNIWDLCAPFRPLSVS